MKSVLISIRPQWCELIANGKKTIEVRKTRPKIDTPFKCYIYCTQDKHGWFNMLRMTRLDGKVIGEFVCDGIAMLAPLNHVPNAIDVEKEACLTREQIVSYLKGKGYGWHISDLKIYDKPRELSEFYSIDVSLDDCCIGCVHHECPVTDEPCKSCEGYRKYLHRPPQSWCYVEGI